MHCSSFQIHDFIIFCVTHMVTYSIITFCTCVIYIHMNMLVVLSQRIRPRPVGEPAWAAPIKGKVCAPEAIELSSNFLKNQKLSRPCWSNIPCLVEGLKLALSIEINSVIVWMDNISVVGAMNLNTVHSMVAGPILEESTPSVRKSLSLKWMYLAQS
jgi:hypothetical protein